MEKLKWLNTASGHIVLLFLVFVVGDGLLVAGQPYGKEIMIGALASLMTALKPETCDKD